MVGRRSMAGRFPEPWRIVEIPNGFVVNDATGRQLGVFYGRADPNATGHCLTIDEARQMALDFAGLPAQRRTLELPIDRPGAGALMLVHRRLIALIRARFGLEETRQ